MALIALFVRQLLATTGHRPDAGGDFGPSAVAGRASTRFSSRRPAAARSRSLELLLVCEEEATYRQGTNTRTETRQVYCQQCSAARDSTRQRGTAVEAECPLLVPAEAMHSFKAGHNAIHWKLVVREDAVGRPDFSGPSRSIVSSGAAARRRGRKRAMSDPAVIIRLDGNGRVYQPGETLSGEYHVEAAATDEVRAIEASVSVVQRRERATRTLPSTSSGGRTPTAAIGSIPQRPQRFSTTLPRSPLSYDGQIVKIRWCMRVRAFLQRGKEVVEQKVFRLGNVPPPKAEVP